MLIISEGTTIAQRSKKSGSHFEYDLFGVRLTGYVLNGRSCDEIVCFHGNIPGGLSGKEVDIVRGVHPTEDLFAAPPYGNLPPTTVQVVDHRVTHLCQENTKQSVSNETAEA